MKYTVIGLWIGDHPIVAGVIEGEHPCVDNDTYEVEGGRWATMVDAADPAGAEELAVQEMRDEDSDEDDHEEVAITEERASSIEAGWVIREIGDDEWLPVVEVNGFADRVGVTYFTHSRKGDVAFDIDEVIERRTHG